MKIEYVPFRDDMIADAAALLSNRHAGHRKTLPLLPERFEDKDVASKTVTTLWNEKYKNGYAAFRNGKMVGYLIGKTSTNPWGRAGYVYLPGYALAPDEDPRLLQDLYARLGDEWVQRGCFDHYLYLSAADKSLIEAMFNIGFGKERVDALLDLRAIEIPEVEPPAGTIIRQAVPGDNAHLGSLSNIIFRALSKPPYWHPTVPEDWDDLREGWSELAEDKEWTVWLALENEEALGAIGFRPEPEDVAQLLVPSKTVYLSVAVTKPQARGRGINTALFWHGLKQARTEGFETCYTNWISPNFLASRFWPRFGFQDVAYRLSKKVNPMIAWARDE